MVNSECGFAIETLTFVLTCPFPQVLVMLGRLQRGAQLLSAEGLLPACKELLVGMMVREPWRGMFCFDCYDFSEDAICADKKRILI